MKNSIFLVLAICVSISIHAQNDKYIQTMEDNITKLMNAKKSADLQPIANAFERIANAEKEAWLPLYYHAYSNIQLALAAMQSGEKGKIEAFVDKAQASVDAMKKLAGDESEILTMQGYVYMARIWESPMVNGAIYSPKASKTWEKAIEKNANNPRPYLLKGQNTFYMPAFFGGGAKNAMPYFEKASTHFTNFEPTSSIHPNWGAETNGYFLKTAGEQLK